MCTPLCCEAAASFRARRPAPVGIVSITQPPSGITELSQIHTCCLDVVQEKVRVLLRDVSSINDDVLVRPAALQVIGGHITKDGSNEAHASDFLFKLRAQGSCLWRVEGVLTGVSYLSTAKCASAFHLADCSEDLVHVSPHAPSSRGAITPPGVGVRFGYFAGPLQDCADRAEAILQFLDVNAASASVSLERNRRSDARCLSHAHRLTPCSGSSRARRA